MEPYEVIASGLFKDELKRLCRRAGSEGRLSRAKSVMSELMNSLQTDPTSVGEVVYTLKHIGLPVRHAVRLPWSIHFAVDEPHRLVYLSKIELLD